MLRLMLALLLLLCGGVIGLHYSRRLTRRREILLGFQTMLSRAALEIAYNSGDLCEVFSDHFAGFDFDRSLPFDDQWERLISTFSYWLRSEDIALLRDFLNGLGKTDTLSQQRHMELYAKRLSEHIAAAENEIEVKGKMYRMIPLSAGMILAILII